MTQAPNQPSAEDVLMGSGSRSAKFKNPGDVVGGKIVSVPKTFEERELKWDGTKYVKGDLKTYPSGDQVYGITALVQTNARDDDEDDGVRCLYIQGKRLKEAVRDAVRQSGAARLEQGGELWIKYTGDGEKANPEAKAPKLWAAKYTAAVATAQDQAWGAPAEAAAQAPTPPPATSQEPPQQAQQAPPPAADNPWGPPPPAGGGFPDDPPF